MDANSLFIFFCVFMLGAASGYFSERVGIVNIGINGMMIFGAMMYCVFGALFNGSSVNSSANGNLGDSYFIVAILLAGFSTVIMGLFFGFSTIYLKTDHVIAGTSINLLGAGIGLSLTNKLGEQLLGGATNLSNPFQHIWDLSSTAGALKGSILFLGLFVVLIIVIFMIIFKFTKFGLRYKSIGENPNAADSQGIKVSRYQWIGMIISSILAGMAGAIFMYSSFNKPFYGEVDGLGFMTLAIMITGSWKLPLILIVSIGFSALYTYGSQPNPNNISPNILKMIPYIVTIGFLILFSKRMQGPKFAGQHFDKSRR
ncbi:ABC transporter permease [Malacoplasma muris]|uniref:ABC transporter permease n=1 Tax=Malacoplasma muris TaxID=2119 RepID=UPI00398E6AB2